MNFGGCAVVISHDRWFLDRVATHILAFEGDEVIFGPDSTFIEEVKDEVRKSGWIKFGEPRFPLPGALPERFVQPEAGRLVLFPSYMWHGTNPIIGDEPRTTIAFDAVPAK